MFGKFNPPPQTTNLQGSLKTSEITISKGSPNSAWPATPYNSTITESTTIDVKKNPFTYLPINVSTPIIITITEIKTGSMFMAEIKGVGNVTFRVNGIADTSALSEGTYIVSVFSDAIVTAIMGNPTAL